MRRRIPGAVGIRPASRPEGENFRPRLTIIKKPDVETDDQDPMKMLLRLLLLMALLPGLMTGLLPLPGAASGFEMVICGSDGVETIRVDAQGDPLSDDPLAGCETCCAACGPLPALVPAAPFCRPVTTVLRGVGRSMAAAPALPVRPALYPSPRGPPSQQEVI